MAIASIFNRLVTIFALVGALGACTTVNFDQAKAESYAQPFERGQLVTEVKEWVDEHEGKSGFIPLTEGMDGLGARLKLIEGAEFRIDAQYFLIKNDIAGRLFSKALYDAAERGVSVRFLVDDIFTKEMDDWLLKLDQHPNIEVRLFNPISRRGVKYFNIAGDFSRANRRMHNKSLTADHVASIIGGRNIAEEYFQLQKEIDFLDFDVFTVGPVVDDIEVQFDEFWNHMLAMPVDLVLKGTSLDEEELLNVDSGIYEQAVNSEFLTQFYDEKVEPIVAHATVLSDHPDKLLTKRAGADLNRLPERLRQIANELESNVLIITPYFVPGKEAEKLLIELAKKGIEVEIVTNSLASNNHLQVHSGYNKYRKSLLNAGIKLYELQAFRNNDFSVNRATLHTKLMVFDKKKIFVGSFNFDPRSININTEMGVFINSEEAGEAVYELIKNDLDESTYTLTLNEENQLRWIDVGDDNKVYKKEPQSSQWMRFRMGFWGIFPIESQL